MCTPAPPARGPLAGGILGIFLSGLFFQPPPKTAIMTCVLRANYARARVFSARRENRHNGARCSPEKFFQRARKSAIMTCVLPGE